MKNKREQIRILHDRLSQFYVKINLTFLNDLHLNYYVLVSDRSLI